MNDYDRIGNQMDRMRGTLQQNRVDRSFDTSFNTRNIDDESSSSYFRGNKVTQVNVMAQASQNLVINN